MTRSTMGRNSAVLFLSIVLVLVVVLVVVLVIDLCPWLGSDGVDRGGRTDVSQGGEGNRWRDSRKSMTIGERRGKAGRLTYFSRTYFGCWTNRR